VGLEPELFSSRGKWITEFTQVTGFGKVLWGKSESKEELVSLVNLNRELFSIYYKYPHKKVPLVPGTLNGVYVKCINLGYYFNIKTGKH
jgi:nitrite reductase/ring-hydroxylating ferredoxin subunit